MHLDHLSFAAGPDGLEATAQRLGAQLGVTFLDGGFHPRFGTRNRILPLTAGITSRWSECSIIRRPTRRLSARRSGRDRPRAVAGWVGWLQSMILRHSRSGWAGPRSRATDILPDGTVLTWHQLGVKDLQVDPQLPFFVQWSRDAVHPSAGGREVELLKIEIAGDQERVDDWLGGRSKTCWPTSTSTGVSRRDRTGLAAAIFSTPRGEVRI